MLIRFATASLAFLFASLALLLAQDQPAANPTQGLIATDRPSFTNSSIVVPLGSFQTENGFLATNNQGQNGADGPETLVRFGLTSQDGIAFHRAGLFPQLERERRLRIWRFGYRSERTTWAYAWWFRCFRHTLPQLSHRRGGRVQRWVRSGATGGLVAWPAFQVDGGRNVLPVLPHPEPQAKSDWPMHSPFGSTTVWIDNSHGPGMHLSNRQAIFPSAACPANCCTLEPRSNSQIGNSSTSTLALAYPPAQ